MKFKFDKVANAGYLTVVDASLLKDVSLIQSSRKFKNCELVFDLTVKGELVGIEVLK